MRKYPNNTAMYVGICTSDRHLGENVKAVGEISLTVNNLKKFKYIWAQWQRQIIVLTT